MVEINLPNFITIGLMSAIFVAAFTWVMQLFGLSTNWMA